ncbi:MAG: tetratricopeptide repeat protein, partial [Planctomycetota bacterium]
MRPRSQPSGGRILEARALERTGQDVGALEQLRIAAEEDPDDVDTHVAIQRLQTARARNLSLRRRYRARGGYLAARLEADRELRKVGFEAAAEPWRSYGLGKMALARGDRALAAEFFIRALAQDAGFLPARVAFAELLLDQGRVGAAETEFRVVLWQDPRSVAGRVGMSSVESLRGRRGRALDWLIESLRESPASDSLA